METTKRKYQKHKKERKIAVEYKLYKSQKKTEEEGTLYVEIRVRNQNNLIRSRLNMKLSDNNFNSLFIESYDSNLLDYANYERTLIENSIRKQDPDNNENFNLTKWYANYQNECDYEINGIDTIISTKLGKMIKAELNDNYNTGGSENCLFMADQISIELIENMLEFLANPNFNFPFASTFLIKYGELFKNFHKYMGLIGGGETGFGLFFFCLIDWKTGFFQKKLRDAILKENPSNIFVLDLINELLEDK